MMPSSSRLTVPTLLVRGVQSDLVSDHTLNEFLAAVPHASSVDVRGAGHMVAGDENDAFSSAVVGFLRTHLGASAAEAEKLAARDEAATALRRLGHTFVRQDASTSLLQQVTATARGLTQQLRASPPRDRLAEYLGSDRMRTLFDEGADTTSIAEGGAVDVARHSSSAERPTPSASPPATRGWSTRWSPA